MRHHCFCSGLKQQDLVEELSAEREILPQIHICAKLTRFYSKILPSYLDGWLQKFVPALRA